MQCYEGQREIGVMSDDIRASDDTSDDIPGKALQQYELGRLEEGELVLPVYSSGDCVCVCCFTFDAEILNCI